MRLSIFCTVEPSSRRRATLWPLAPHTNRLLCLSCTTRVISVVTEPLAT